jgi:hypothetical protein
MSDAAKCDVCGRELTTEENCEDGGRIPPELCDKPDGRDCHVAAAAVQRGREEAEERIVSWLNAEADKGPDKSICDGARIVAEAVANGLHWKEPADG